MGKLLSIIIPAYNVGAYLHQTLESCMIDSGDNEGSYEVIVVNDGSQDSTRKIAEEYVHKYGNIFRLINKENGGYGSAVNAGINAANGKYIKILDGDDWYDKKALEELLDKIKDSECDAILTDFVKYNDKTGEKKPCRCSLNKYSVLPNRLFELDQCDITSILWEMHCICYKTSILQQNYIRLTEHCFYTDSEYVLFPLAFARTAIYLPIELYIYRCEREGQSISLEGLTKHINDFEPVIRDINQYFDCLDGYRNKKLIEYKIRKIYRYYIMCILLLPPNQINKTKLKDFIESTIKKYPHRLQYRGNEKILLLRYSKYLLYRPYCIYRHRKIK